MPFFRLLIDDNHRSVGHPTSFFATVPRLANLTNLIVFHLHRHEILLLLVVELLIFSTNRLQFTLFNNFAKRASQKHSLTYSDRDAKDVNHAPS